MLFLLGFFSFDEATQNSVHSVLSENEYEEDKNIKSS
jgi:hypothetical protein